MTSVVRELTGGMSTLAHRKARHEETVASQIALDTLIYKQQRDRAHRAHRVFAGANGSTASRAKSTSLRGQGKRLRNLAPLA